MKFHYVLENIFPKAEEIQLIFDYKLSIVKLFIHINIPIWVEVDHHFSLKLAIKNACNYVDLLDYRNNFGFQVVYLKFDNINNIS
ncbi:unnamed protein product [Paramecium sonneborni]|uniref:Uncharacterized protein n=1 Tax=Paramecium sonneborni TaxID=65129 RepID=A0A8S1PVC5_9CILI|nr:unnamed protein product [Paramecium sonneborni]